MPRRTPDTTAYLVSTTISEPGWQLAVHRFAGCGHERKTQYPAEATIPHTRRMVCYDCVRESMGQDQR